MPETGRRPAGLRPWDSSGESLPGLQIPSLPSTGAALSCPTTCPGQGDVLLPFLEAGLSGFLEEGRRGPAQHQAHPGEGRETRLGESPRAAVGEQVCPHCWQASGFQSTICFCHCQPITYSAKATVYQAFQTAKPFHLQFSFFSCREMGYYWLCFTHEEIEVSGGRVTCTNQKG